MHCSWYEDTAMSDKPLPSWSLRFSRETEKQNKCSRSMTKDNGGKEIVMEAIRLQFY